jgi:hypothetical protein
LTDSLNKTISCSLHHKCTGGIEDRGRGAVLVEEKVRGGRWKEVEDGERVWLRMLY